MLSIRTQDRMALVPYKYRIIITDYTEINGEKKYEIYCDIELGTYATKKRALEVLDEIERAVYGKFIIPTAITQNENHWIYTNGIISSLVNESKEIQVLPYVYQMPKE